MAAGFTRGGVEHARPTGSFLNVPQGEAVTLEVEYLHDDLGIRSVSTVATDASNRPSSHKILVEKESNIVRTAPNYKSGSL